MARQAHSIFKQTIIATAALTEARAVSIAGAVPAISATCLGFADATTAIGDAVSVHVLGTATAEAGAAIAVGAALELDASGRVITKAAGVTVGRALEAAGALGAFIEIVLIPN